MQKKIRFQNPYVLDRSSLPEQFFPESRHSEDSFKKKSNPNSKNEIPCASAKEGNRGSDLVKDVLSQHQNSGLSHENRSKMYQNHPKSLWGHHKSANWIISDFLSAVDVLSTPTELRNRQF